MRPFQMEIVREKADTEGVRWFQQVGEWVLRNSDPSLETYLRRVTLSMDEATTFCDGVKTGFGLLGIKDPIPRHIAESHVEELRGFIHEGESLHQAVERLGFLVIEKDPEMVACVQYILPRLGYANEIVFTSGAGYGESLAELSARDQFNSQSIEMLEEEFGPELNFNDSDFWLDFDQ